jgi:hypothetical protein
MSAYIKLTTMEYPRHEGDIRLEHPEITENQTGDTFPIPQTYALVNWVDPPIYNPETQIVWETTPINANGSWQMVWEIRDLTADEIIKRQDLILGRSPLAKSGSPPDVIA